MMSSARFGGDIVAVSRDGIFENCRVLALDAQINGCLFESSN